jgi:nanoRNase/pAp phosphatase (c-di-AMP/oligoRNAs hydrolase)
MPEDLPKSARKESKNPGVAKDFFEGFREVIDRVTEKETKVVRAALFCHPGPDPDAIGSMMGMQWLLNRAWGIESDIFYTGEISHPQNNAVCNLLDPQLRKSEEEYKADQYGLHILLDTIPSNAGTGSHKVPFDIVVDHHKDLPNGGYSGLVLHMKVGSCCAIVYRLMEHFCKDTNWFKDNVDLDSKVATGMIAGIVTDCEFLVGDDATEYDSTAKDGLWPFRNSNYLKQIVFFKRPRFWVDVKAAACQDVVVDDEGFAIVCLGLIPEKQRDLIADMAEEMVSWVSVETAIAFGIVGGVRIEGSVRSLNSSLSVAEFCKKLGQHGRGGGKHGKGAYRYDLGGMSLDPDEDDQVEKDTCKLIKDKETKRIRRMVGK